MFKIKYLSVAQLVKELTGNAKDVIFKFELKVTSLLLSSVLLLVPNSIAEASRQINSDADMKRRIEKSFEPLYEMVQGFAKPIALIFSGFGFYLIMAGEIGKGRSMVKWAVLGYVAIQLLPGVMDIFGGVGDALRENMNQGW